MSQENACQQKRSRILLQTGSSFFSMLLKRYFFNYAKLIVPIIWRHLIVLCSVGAMFVALLAFLANLFVWLVKARREQYEYESTFAISARILGAALWWVVTIAYKLAFATLRISRGFTTYVRELSRSRPEKYRRISPDDIYHYETLDSTSQEIRLIRLTRGPLTGIRCSLKHFKLQEAPAYEAISYTWGTSTKDRLVFFNGHWFPITRNVYKILQDRGSYFQTR